ncbi:CDP-glycerol glycerophosphotransferase family protein [Mammaliicoccus fleurettii]|uniref:CDP-glycerol glycerophosphotransferase family protein n=1 Tax=Mammaliicoccus fleurettii TaxID=150056 RepID=UPI002DBBABAC|nr:CDP-glycerol glycerophosphotransferase family protein [Mammaliicoccus fleurettii]MEB7781078.1 CDP-glycerol glycerophosphotransferase family protein [Mammaliicoccus fleurettii]
MRDKKLWIFNATNDFAGNPKWLYIYINMYRKDIKAYWMCDDVDVINMIKKMGFNAELYSSKKAEKIKESAGVFVVHQVKEHIPDKFKDEVVILNLWHGIGLKPIERYVESPSIKYRTYRKYIKYNSIYRNNQLFLVTSQFMENHFSKMLNLENDQLIKSGYPSVMFNKVDFKNNTNEIIKSKKSNKHTKVALYAPTFRDYSMEGFFGEAISDIDLLTKSLKENNILLIFKMHYLVREDLQYLNIKEKYSNNPNIIFWDDKNDIYEVFDEIDIGIVDYSSIYYDLLAAGVNKFVRYIYDFEKYISNRKLIGDYRENTTGIIAKSFEDLLNVLGKINKLEVDTKKIEYIKDKFWGYDDNDFEGIINKTLNFKIKEKKLSTLYSFDIFDTILQRKTLRPEGIFYFVKEKLLRTSTNIPSYVIQNYPRVRIQAENYVRDYYRKSQYIRNDKRLEIDFIDIINRIQSTYDLNDYDSKLLYDLEIEAELLNIEKRDDGYEEITRLIDRGEKVVLISDMYLPKSIIKQMLKSVNPKLERLPIYLSSEGGNQKSTSLLYLDVFEDLKYDYKNWIHYGDNNNADINVPKRLNIIPIKQKLLDFNNYESQFVNRNKNYDTYLLGTLLARFRNKNKSTLEYYVFGYISSYFVPYVHWTIKKAIKEEIETLYFISRDGELLKKIADKIIEKKNYDIKTKYIYGSRKAWRIPSFIDEIDDEFYSPFGNFSGLNGYKSMLDALYLTEQEFIELFPDLVFLKDKETFNHKTKELVRLTAKYNKKYNDHLLLKASKDREIVIEYLNQEIDFNEKFAFVEYWGRGYTQDCLHRLLRHTVTDTFDTTFFYARSIYQSSGNIIRYNYTSKMTSLIFVESIFANIPYKSVSGYQYDNNKAIPVIEYKDYNKKLYSSMNKLLSEFIEMFYSLDFIELDEIERNFYDFGIDYFKNKPDDELIIKYFAPLKDAVILFEPEIEYAPAITYKMASKKLLGKKVPLRTKNKTMSIKRSPKGIQIIYKMYNKYIKQNKILKTIYKIIKK